MTNPRKTIRQRQSAKSPRGKPARKQAKRVAAGLIPADLESWLPFPVHGAVHLPALDVVSYNLELRTRGKFIGDMASRTAFSERLDAWRAIARKRGKDPFGRTATAELSKKKLNRVLQRGDPHAAGIIQSAIDDFARAFVEVIRRFRRHAWQHIDHIVVGGGFRDGRLGELAIGRAQSLLREQGLPIELHPIRHHPDEAGLVGVVHLVPTWMLRGFESVLAIDIGGSTIRCGLVKYKINGKGDIRNASVGYASQWHHRDDDASRRDIINELVDMLRSALASARKQGARVSPIVGIGCPGRIEIDGSITRGAQNLPGNWEGSAFHLPSVIGNRLGRIGGQRPVVIMHNDAVIQGLSALPAMRDIAQWGVLTIGTGLGNAAFAQPAKAE
jgi:predicted NBD/HSP70 family sugar kinase